MSHARFAPLLLLALTACTGTDEPAPDDSGDDDAGPDVSCQLPGDHQAVLPLSAGAFERNALADQGTAVWEGRGWLDEPVTVGPLSPGDTVSVTLALADALTVDDTLDDLSIQLLAPTVTPEAQAVLEPEVASAGLALEDPGRGVLNATEDGELLALDLRGFARPPAVGEALTCASMAIVVPDTVDLRNADIPVVPGAELVFDLVYVAGSVAADVPLAPPRWTFDAPAAE